MGVTSAVLMVLRQPPKGAALALSSSAHDSRVSRCIAGAICSFQKSYQGEGGWNVLAKLKRGGKEELRMGKALVRPPLSKFEKWV